MEFHIQKPTYNNEKANLYNDLTNDKNWVDTLEGSYIKGYALEYLNTREDDGTFSSSDLLKYNNPTQESGRVFNSLKTYSAKIIKNKFDDEIDENIKSKYDHTENIKFNINRIGLLPESIIRYIDKFDKGKKKLMNLKKVSSQEGIKYQLQTISNKDVDGKSFVSSNYDFYSNLGVPPEIFGYDIAKNMSKELQKTSAFVCSSLFSYDHTTPQNVSLGSTGFFCGILLDILFHIFRKSESSDNEFTNNYEKYKNVVYDSNEIDKSKSDLYKIEDINNRVNLPKAYGAWCVYYVINSANYKLKYDNTQISFDKSTFKYKYDEDSRRFKENKNYNSPIDIKDLVEIIGESLIYDNKNNFYLEKLQEILELFESKINKSEFGELISSGISCLIFNMILVNNDFTKYDKNYIIELANKEFKNMTLILRKLGKELNSPMGGTLLLGDKEFETTKLNSVSKAVSDVQALDEVNMFIDTFLNDIVEIKRDIKNAVDNLRDKFWKKDVIFWLEIIIEIFNPYIDPSIGSYSDSYIGNSFEKIRKIIKDIHNKEIQFMKKYIEDIERLKKGNKKETFMREKNYHILKKEIVINYLKRQTYIIYFVLNSILEPSSTWTLGENPIFDKNVFKKYLMYTETSTDNEMIKELVTLSSKTNDPELKKEINSLRVKLTPDVTIRTKENIIKKYGDTPENFNTDEFWRMLILRLKNFPENKQNKDMLYGLYVPVYTETFYGGTYNFYLLDVMKLVLDFKLTKFSVRDLKTKKIPCDEKAYIVGGETIDLKNNIKAVTYEFFQKLYDKLYDIDEKEKRYYLVRLAIFHFFNTSIYQNDKLMIKKSLGQKETKIIRDIELKSDSEKYNEKKCIYITDIETIKFILINN